MADAVIRVENLGKKYIIAHQKQKRYTALWDVLAEKVCSLGISPMVDDRARPVAEALGIDSDGVNLRPKLFC